MWSASIGPYRTKRRRSRGSISAGELVSHTTLPSSGSDGKPKGRRRLPRVRSGRRSVAGMRRRRSTVGRSRVASIGRLSCVALVYFGSMNGSECTAGQ